MKGDESVQNTYRKEKNNIKINKKYKILICRYNNF